MSDRAILILFFSLSIWWMSGEFIKRVTRTPGEVKTKIHYYYDLEEERMPNVYDEEEKPRRA